MCRFNSNSKHFSVYLPCCVNMSSMSLFLNKWPWAKCVLHNRKREKIVSPVWGWGGQSRIPTAQVKQALCEIRKKSGQQRGRREQRGGEGRDLWAHSWREMGELEHFPLVDTQHLWPDWETGKQEKDKYVYSKFLSSCFSLALISVTRSSCRGGQLAFEFQAKSLLFCLYSNFRHMSHLSPGQAQLR